MRTVEVPQKDWARTLNEFSALHQGWLVSLDVLGPTSASNRKSANFRSVGSPPNRALVVLPSRSQRHDSTANRLQITHLIPSATHVRIERTNEGADVALEIESDEGLAAILRFKSTAPSNAVEGASEFFLNAKRRLVSSFFKRSVPT